LRAAERLADLAAEPVRDIAHEVHAPNGLDRELVLRSIAVRTHEHFATLLRLVELDAGHHARLLLRPMVEDLIFAAWLRTLDDTVADEFVHLRTKVDITEGFARQHQFLPRAYSLLGVDPVPSDALGMQLLPMIALDQSPAALRDLGKSFGWDR